MDNDMRIPERINITTDSATVSYLDGKVSGCYINSYYPNYDYFPQYYYYSHCPNCSPKIDNQLLIEMLKELKEIKEMLKDNK